MAGTHDALSDAVSSVGTELAMKRVFSHSIHRWFSLLGIALCVIACRSKHPRSETKDLTHGTVQMERLLEDRLEMNQYATANGPRYVTSGDSIFVWAARRFCAPDGSIRYFWNPRPPEHFDGGCVKPINGRIGRIAIADFSKRTDLPAETFEHLWRVLFFELLNIARTKEVAELRAGALSGAYDEQTFCNESMRIEHGVLIELCDVYESVWLPWCRQHGFESNARYWVRPPPFEQWLVEVEIRDPAYRRHYAATFTALMATASNEMGRNK